MKALLNFVSVLLIAGGVALGLDGLKVINLMTSGHHRRWLLVGAVSLIVGVVMVIATNKSKAKA